MMMTMLHHPALSIAKHTLTLTQQPTSTMCIRWHAGTTKSTSNSITAGNSHKLQHQHMTQLALTAVLAGYHMAMCTPSSISWDRQLLVCRAAVWQALVAGSLLSSPCHSNSSSTMATSVDSLQAGKLGAGWEHQQQQEE
jgi:hypothetical protein